MTLSVDQTIAISVGFLQFCATLAIALTVYRQTIKLKKLELTKQLNDAFNLVTTIALTRDENLIALDSIGRESINEPIEVRRKRWCAFVWLVALENTFIMNKNKMVDGKYAGQALRHQLEIVLADDLIYLIVTERGYDPAFVSYCETMRKDIVRNRSQRGESQKFVNVPLITPAHEGKNA